MQLFSIKFTAECRYGKRANGKLACQMLFFHICNSIGRQEMTDKERSGLEVHFLDYAVIRNADNDRDEAQSEESRFISASQDNLSLDLSPKIYKSGYLVGRYRGISLQQARNGVQYGCTLIQRR